MRHLFSHPISVFLMLSVWQVKEVFNTTAAYAFQDIPEQQQPVPRFYHHHYSHILLLIIIIFMARINIIIIFIRLLGNPGIRAANRHVIRSQRTNVTILMMTFRHCHHHHHHHHDHDHNLAGTVIIIITIIMIMMTMFQAPS